MLPTHMGGPLSSQCPVPISVPAHLVLLPKTSHTLPPLSDQVQTLLPKEIHSRIHSRPTKFHPFTHYQQVPGQHPCASSAEGETCVGAHQGPDWA